MSIAGDGEQTRDFTHGSDVVRANLSAMDGAIADGRALNIGGGRRVGVNHLTQLIGGARVCGPARPGDVRHTRADCTAASHILGWRPEIDVERGVAERLKPSGG